MTLALALVITLGALFIGAFVIACLDDHEEIYHDEE